MEKYKILNRIGKGAQGFVYLAQHKTEGKNYILKQVECNDESECNRAFKESLALLDLKHSYICQYKEFFVSWDKELSAMFVTVVSDYYETGNLTKFLQEMRKNRESVSEKVVMKWIGQILDAFIYIHKKGFVHRDLKPNNIYITGDDNSLAIGDFGVPAVMEDMRTKTRGLQGSQNYMAPEVLTQPYDMRTDMWAIGCVLLELVTCDLYETGEIMGKLCEIKHSDEALTELLEEIRKVYSDDLVALLKIILVRDHSIRPTPSELTEGNYYVKQCLAISNTVIVERKRRAMSASTTKSVPRDRGIMPVVEYILDNLINESCVKQGMQYLAELTKEENSTLSDSGKRIVAKAMKDYVQEADIQVWGCTILNNIVPTANSNDLLYCGDILTVIPMAMKFHYESPGVLQAAASLIMPLAVQEHASQFLGDSGSVHDIIAAMKRFPDDVDLQTACCNAMWSLTVNDDNVRIVTEEKGVNQVIDALNKHKDSASLVEGATAALIALSMEDVNLDIMNKAETIRTLIEVLDVHQREPKAVKNICMALAAMVEPDEECAYKVLTNIREDGTEEAGIPYITEAYRLHKDNAQVVQNITTLLMELCEYDEICAEIKHLNLDDKVLHEIHRRFKENQEIMIPCEQALVKLGAKIRLQHPSAKQT